MTVTSRQAGLVSGITFIPRFGHQVVLGNDKCSTWNTLGPDSIDKD